MKMTFVSRKLTIKFFKTNLLSNQFYYNNSKISASESLNQLCHFTNIKSECDKQFNLNRGAFNVKNFQINNNKLLGINYCAIKYFSLKIENQPSYQNLENQFNDQNKQFDEEKERELRRKRQLKYTNYSFIALCGGFVAFCGWALYSWGKPKIDEEGNLIVDEFTKYPILKQYFLRTYDALINFKEVLKEPSRELLLPPPLTYPYEHPPYTLVMELNGIFLHPEWTYQTGWRFKKRPFVDNFLQQCGPPLFELVIFTKDNAMTVFNLIESLDPNGAIMHKLYRDSTRFVNGKHVKDLNCLNRNLSKTIHIDWDKDACSLNPQNCLILDKWVGDGNDGTLLDLASFLRTIAAQNVDDVREIIAHYSQFDKPLEVFKENQRIMAEEEERRHKKKTSFLASQHARNFNKIV